MKKKGKFSKINLGRFFRGVVYRGMCVGEILGNKRQDRGKKNFRGPEILGGTFGGNAKKGWENIFGECWGSCEPQQILGAEILGGTFGGNGKRGFGGSVGGAVNPNKF